MILMAAFPLPSNRVALYTCAYVNGHPHLLSVDYEALLIVVQNPQRIP